MKKLLTHIHPAEFSLLAITIAALGNAFILTLGEGLRLLLVVGGLVYLYYRYGRKSVHDETVLHYGVSILGLLAIFFLTQFDPAFASLHRMAPQKFGNWYAWATGGAVLAGCAAYLWSHYAGLVEKGIGKWLAEVRHSLTSFDRVVLLTGFGILLFMALMNTAYADSVLPPQPWSSIKLGFCILAYLTTIGIYRDTSGSDSSRLLAINKLRRAYKYILTVFGLVILLSVYKYSSAYYDKGKGLDYIREGAYGKARVILQQALEKTGYHSEDMYVALGHAYLGQDQFEEAEIHFNHARHLAVGSSTFDKRIGDIYSSLSYWRKAIESYKLVRSRQENPVYVFDELCLAYLKTGQRRRLTELITEFHRLPKLQLSDPSEYVELGIALVNSGFYPAAELQLNIALELDENYASAYYGLGLAYIRKEQWEDAQRQLDRAVVLDDSLIEAYNELGIAYKNLNQLDKAIYVYRKALALSPDDLLALGHLAGLYELSGARDQARQLEAKMQVHIPASEWGGVHGGKLAWGGSCWYEMELYEGAIEITIHASGTPASDIWPIMVIDLDGKRISSISVERGGIYKVEAQVETTGHHKLSITFINDSSSSEIGDRNLTVEDAMINYL